MKPKIDGTVFGSVTIGGEQYPHDVIIRLDGGVRKRKKELSKAVYGTSHTISVDEARHVYQKRAERLIVGTGQTGMVELSPEAEKYFKRKGCAVELMTTRKAMKAWNDASGAVIALLHVTC